MKTRVKVPGRGWAWFGFALGITASIAANVAHSYIPKPPDGLSESAREAWQPPDDWSPEPGAVVSAMFWPIAVFCMVEVLARVPWPSGRLWAWLRYGGALPVALVAALVSYRHLAGLLGHYGEDPVTVLVGPLAVDGLMVVCSSALLATGKVRRAAMSATEPATDTPTAPQVADTDTPTSGPVADVADAAVADVADTDTVADRHPATPPPAPATVADPTPPPPPRHPATGSAKTTHRRPAKPATDPDNDRLVTDWLNNPKGTVDDLAALLGVSRRTAERRLSAARTARTPTVNGTRVPTDLIPTGGHGE